MKKVILFCITSIFYISTINAQAWVFDSLPGWTVNTGNKNILISNQTNTTLQLKNTSYLQPTTFIKTAKIEFQNASSDKTSYIFSAIPPIKHTNGIGISTKAAFDAPEIDNLYCHPNGNVGIRNNNPLYTLDINGDLNTSEIIVQKENSPKIRLSNNNYISFPNFFTKASKLEFVNSSADKTSYLFSAIPPNGHTFGIGITTKASFDSNEIDNLFCHPNGNVGIRNNAPFYTLDVNGTVHAKEIIVDLDYLADYVFNSDYNLMPLRDLDSFIKTNKHLPGLPSASDVQKKGLNMGEMQNLLLKKIEELTLYSIEQSKSINELKDLIITQKSRIELLEKNSK